MAFYFKRKETVAKAAKRVAHERLEHALGCLKNSHHAESIHGVRKDIKKVRAITKLVRRQIGKKTYKRQTRLLREAAHLLAPWRDAHVRAAALKRVVSETDGSSQRPLGRLEDSLQSAVRKEAKCFRKDHTALAVKRKLRRADKAWRNLDLKGNGWEVIAAQLKDSYAEGRRAYARVLKEPSSEHLHEWRKRVKELWCYLRLLRQVCPEQMDAAADELDALGECLGEQHDLDMLITVRITGHNGQTEQLSLKVEKRRAALQQSALAAGKRFYQETPGAFCNRLGRYWRSWREKSTASRSGSALAER